MISANRATTVNKTDGLPLPKRYWAILATALGVGMSVIDGTIANVALPTIARDLGTEPSVTIWVVNAYQLAITISLLSFSSLGDIYGYRRIYLSGIAVFSVTSLICALSDSFWTLTAARIMQGFGAAAITSVNTALLRIIYPKKFLGRGMGINALVVAVSIAAGPTIASAILSLGSWHWLFAINVPFGIAALVIGISHLPGNPVKVYGRRFDKVSCLMNALTFSLEGIAHKQSVVLVIGGIVALGIIGYFFVRQQLRQRFPLLPVDLMRIPIFSLSIGTSISSFTAQMLAMISLPFFLQNTLGRSDVATGLLLTPSGNHDYGSDGRTPGRKDTPRNIRRNRHGHIRNRTVPARHIAGPSHRYGHYLAFVCLRGRLRLVSDTQQQHDYFLRPDQPQRRCKRHARHGAVIRTDIGSDISSDDI